MPPDSLPDDVRRLLDERAAAREERDLARADALRDRIAALGWEVQDAGGRSTARPILVREPEADPIEGAGNASTPRSSSPPKITRTTCCGSSAASPRTRPRRAGSW